MCFLANKRTLRNFQRSSVVPNCDGQSKLKFESLTRMKGDIMRRPITHLGTVMGVLSLFVAAAYAEEEDLSPEQVPTPVMEAAKARFKDAEVTGAAKEMDDDKLVYEVFLNLKGQKIDMILTPEGEIVVIEKAIAKEDLPDAVAQTLEDNYPNATYKTVEEFISVEEKNEKLEYYEAVLVTPEKKEWEVKLTTDGKIESQEAVGSH